MQHIGKPVESLTSRQRQQLTPRKSSGTAPPSQPIANSNGRLPVIECSECNGLGYLRANAPVGDPNFGKLGPCPCQSAGIEQRRFKRLVRISGLLPGELALRFTDVVERASSDTAEMLKLARAFVARPWGMLTLWGGYGNGKTLVLQAIVNECRHQNGVWGTYVRLKDLIDYIRAGNAPDAQGDARQRYEELKACPVLAIDECDGPRMTDYAEEFRRAFFDDRYRLALCREAHTILAMNCDPATLSGDIWDRLRDGRFQIHHNQDTSMRPAMTWGE